VPVVAFIVAALFLALAVAEPAVAASRYTVMPYDTLFSIARRFHVPLPLLEQINGIHDPSRLRPGQVLIIPDAVPAVAARRAPTAGATTAGLPYTAHSPRDSRPASALRGASYIVRPGDTLYRLALRHGTTVGAIEAVNGLRSPAIRVGQVIVLPQTWAPPATAAALRPAVAASAVLRPVALRAAAAAPDARLALSADPAPRPSAVPDTPFREAPGFTGSRREDAVLALAPAVQDPAVPAGVRTRHEPAPHAAAAARTALRARVRETALGYLGVPYHWGGTTSSGVDCSGLVYAVYSPYVANLPRTSYEQWTAGVAVERADLAVGDLVFFNTDGRGASHVGIYVGGGQFVHPAATAQRVVVDRLDAPYYLTHYMGARRVL